MNVSAERNLYVSYNVQHFNKEHEEAESGGGWESGTGVASVTP